MQAIKSLDGCTVEGLSDPSKLFLMPFPSTWAPPSRFALDNSGSFRFMGREKFGELHAHATQLRRAGETLSLLGTMGFGKSHTLAALSVLLLRQLWDGLSTLRVLYIPDCDEYIKRPLDTLLAAAMLAFAQDEAKLTELRACDSVDDVVRFCRRQPAGSLLFVLDQAHYLNEDAHLRQQILAASSIHGVVTAVSINAPSVKALQIKDPSHNLLWLGGMQEACGVSVRSCIASLRRCGCVCLWLCHCGDRLTVAKCVPCYRASTRSGSSICMWCHCSLVHCQVTEMRLHGSVVMPLRSSSYGRQMRSMLQGEYAAWIEHFQSSLPRTPGEDAAAQEQHLQAMASATGRVPLFARLFLRPAGVPAGQPWTWDRAWQQYRSHHLVANMVPQLLEFARHIRPDDKAAHGEVLRSFVLGVYSQHAGRYRHAGAWAASLHRFAFISRYGVISKKE